MALIHNPMADLTGPLHRVESSLNQLCHDLGALDVLPAVDEGVSRTNERLARVEQEVSLTRASNEQMAATLESIRGELSEVVRLLATALAGGPRDGVAGSRLARDGAGGTSLATAPALAAGSRD